MPFGTALNAESTTALSKRFTSYERSDISGLDYAVNRTYNPGQGRFTQVDPIGMGASSLSSPQTLNLYTYCGNDPINHTDPSGLFFGFLKKLFKWILVAVAVVVAVLTIVAAPATLVGILGSISAGANAASQLMTALGYKKAGLIFGIIAAATGFGSIIASKIGGTTFASASISEKVNLLGARYGALGGVGAIANSFRGRTGDKENDVIIRQTVEDVINRLANNSKCLDFIKSKSKESPIDVIAGIYGRKKIKYVPYVDGYVASAPIGKGSNGDIEVYDSFFTKSIGGYSKRYGMNSLRTRQLALLHELLHLSGDKHNDLIESIIITDRIAKICFGVTPKKG